MPTDNYDVTVSTKSLTEIMATGTLTTGGTAEYTVFSDGATTTKTWSSTEAVKEAIKLILDRPSVRYRPTLYRDGDTWLAFYSDIEHGICGYGDTPEDAMTDFDERWRKG